MAMTIDRKSYTLVALLAVAAGGCTANDISLGAAVKNNNAAQIVEPEPKYADEMVADGNQTAGAQERYRKGGIKKPVGVKTTTQSGGGSN
jgi:Ni,Fe-hydrogenase III small subunit